MKAIDTELTKFLGAEAQYYVPIYQRKYSWKKDNCLKLIDDILKVASDTEIKDTLKTLKIYSLSSSRTKTILDKLENNRRKEYVPTSEYTIEHIMPQTLSDDWKSDLGADANRIHETYVHTIGNLTLTGYNSEYQNKRFSDKVDCTDKAGNAIGYRHTPIKISSYLTTVSKWGEDEILARAEMLSDELITIWKYPKKD